MAFFNTKLDNPKMQDFYLKNKQITQITKRKSSIFY